MSNPISCLFVHQGKEVFHITLDLDPHFIGSLSRSDIWFEVVDVSFHQSDVPGDPVANRLVADICTDKF